MRWVAALVNALWCAVTADLAVAVAGQGSDDEVLRVPADDGPALRVAVADRCDAHVIVMSVDGIERESSGRGSVDVGRDVLHAHRDPDLGPGVLVRAPGLDAIDGRNAEPVNRAGRGRCGQRSASKRDGTGGDHRNTAQHGRLPPVNGDGITHCLALAACGE